MPVVPFVSTAIGARELASLRLNTRAFIAADPTLVELVPRLRVKTGTGTKWIEQTARPDQVGRLVDLTIGGGLAAASSAVATEDGIQRREDYQLILPHDGEIGLYDTFTDADGVRYEVTSLLPDNDYEKRAAVTRYG